jgi:hypothetical protein
MSNSLDHLIGELASHAAAVRANWRDAKYPGFHAFVLAQGREYTPQVLPKKYRRGRLQACFDNAYRAARRHGLIYIEGFAALGSGPFFPILHAWCVEPGSHLVIDRTWGKPGEVYYGVPINLEYRKRQAGSVLDNWQAGYPILQKTTAESEWRQL